MKLNGLLILFVFLFLTGMKCIANETIIEEYYSVTDKKDYNLLLELSNKGNYIVYFKDTESPELHLLDYFSIGKYYKEDGYLYLIDGFNNFEYGFQILKNGLKSIDINILFENSAFTLSQFPNLSKEMDLESLFINEELSKEKEKLVHKHTNLDDAAASLKLGAYNFRKIDVILYEETFVFWINGLFVCEGKWNREKNVLYLKNNEFNFTMEFLILENSIQSISNLPGLLM